MTRRSINVTQFWLTVGLFSLPGLSFVIAGYIRFRTGLFSPMEVDRRSYLIFAVLVSLLWALVVGHFGLNRISTLLTLKTGIGTAAKVCACCMMLSLSLFFFYRVVSFARIFVIMACCLLFVLSLLLIHLFRWILLAMDKSRNGRIRIAILGADQFASKVASHFSNNHI